MGSGSVMQGSWRVDISRRKLSALASVWAAESPDSSFSDSLSEGPGDSFADSEAVSSSPNDSAESTENKWVWQCLL